MGHHLTTILRGFIPSYTDVYNHTSNRVCYGVITINLITIGNSPFLKVGKWLSIQVEVDPRCLLFFFKKNGMLNSPKESESQSERDVPNGWIQIDDIRPTVDC